MKSCNNNLFWTKKWEFSYYIYKKIFDSKENSLIKNKLYVLLAKRKIYKTFLMHFSENNINHFLPTVKV